MIKTILFASLIFSAVISCGKKGSPIYIDPSDCLEYQNPKIKNISFIFLICCLLASCGKKGAPTYEDPDKKVEKIIILTNKA